MWFFPNLAGRWRARQSLWAPVASVRVRRQAPMAFRAVFRVRSGQNRRAHSTPGERPGRGAAYASMQAAGIAARDGNSRDGHSGEEDSGAVGTQGTPGDLPGRTEPTELVDSMEVPGRSCLWIPMYWERVWNVFSCRLEHLRSDIRIIQYPRWKPAGGPNCVHPVTYSSALERAS